MPCKEPASEWRDEHLSPQIINKSCFTSTIYCFCKKMNVKRFSLPFLTSCFKKNKLLLTHFSQSPSIPHWHQTDHCQNDETSVQTNVPSGLKISVVSKLRCTKRLTFTILFYSGFKERLIWRSVNSHKIDLMRSFMLLDEMLIYGLPPAGAEQERATC